MGREVRRVPPNWEHPRNEDGRYIPLYDQTYESARREWLDGYAAHEPAEHDGLDYWEYDGMPPVRADYRPYPDEEATWYQVYETVSEGTPVSPPFATQEELIAHLAEHGDKTDHGKGWTLSRAKAFVESGWAPSGMIVGGRYIEGKLYMGETE